MKHLDLFSGIGGFAIVPQVAYEILKLDGINLAMAMQNRCTMLGEYSYAFNCGIGCNGKFFSECDAQRWAFENLSISGRPIK